MNDADEIIERLFVLRNKFSEVVDDPYGRGRVDSAIEDLQDCSEAIDQHKQSGLWTDRE